jgi:serine protease Do
VVYSARVLSPRGGHGRWGIAGPERTPTPSVIFPLSMRTSPLVPALLFVTSLGFAAEPLIATPTETIQRIKPSIVAVGTFQKPRSPAFSFSGTGFAVGDGSLIATNAHVLPKVIDSERREMLVIAVPGMNSDAQIREVKAVAISKEFDIAVLKLEGPRLRPLALGDSSQVREGQGYLFTGFPIGAVLGLIPVTHKAMVSAVTPIAIPAARASQLDARTVSRLATGAYSIFQLDGTAYPGNSGSPLYHTETGDVVAIINMVFVKGSRESALSQPSGITYAIPIEPLRELLQTLK